MSLTCAVTDDGAVIRLKGRFDFNAHREFRGATSDALSRVTAPELRLDFSGVDYMDSAALGMLLILHDHAKRAGRTVAITGCSGMVKGVIEISSFSKLFSIS
jgi:anti-anti-sigma factor